MHKTNCERGNFPIDGPVMQNRTHGWEPTSEKMTPCEGIIREDTIMYLMFEGVKLLMSVLKQLQVITLASTAVYRHVSDFLNGFLSRVPKKGTNCYVTLQYKFSPLL